MLLIVASHAAFSAEPPSKKNVQVLPASEGILKVLYYNPSVRNVTVKIFNEDGLVFQDNVKIDKGENGFMKRYVIEDRTSSVYWVEIADEDTAYRYRVLQFSNGKMWATYWDDYSTIDHAIAAK